MTKTMTEVYRAAQAALEVWDKKHGEAARQDGWYIAFSGRDRLEAFWCSSGAADFIAWGRVVYGKEPQHIEALKLLVEHSPNEVRYWANSEPGDWRRLGEELPESLTVALVAARLEL